MLLNCTIKTTLNQIKLTPLQTTQQTTISARHSATALPLDSAPRPWGSCSRSRHVPPSYPWCCTSSITWRHCCIRLLWANNEGSCMVCILWFVYTNIILITTELYLPSHFDVYQRPSSEEIVQFLFRFLPRSDVTGQEISRTSGSVYGCPRPSSQNAVPPFGCLRNDLYCVEWGIKLYSIHPFGCALLPQSIWLATSIRLPIQDCRF